VSFSHIIASYAVLVNALGALCYSFFGAAGKEGGHYALRGYHEIAFFYM